MTDPHASDCGIRTRGICDCGETPYFSPSTLRLYDHPAQAKVESMEKYSTYLEQENSVLHSKLRQLEIKVEKAEKALAVEREECARVADDYAKEMEGITEEEHAAQTIAQIIRGRGEK